MGAEREIEGQGPPSCPKRGPRPRKKQAYVCMCISSRCTCDPIWEGLGGLQTERLASHCGRENKRPVGPWPLSWEEEDLQLDTS